MFSLGGKLGRIQRILGRKRDIQLGAPVTEFLESVIEEVRTLSQGLGHLTVVAQI